MNWEAIDGRLGIMPIPETSVVIPNWNGSDLLKTCLSSLKRQIYQDFEIIVVDNGSSDDSIQYIESVHPEVRIIKLPVNKGFCAAVNSGIKSARGKYVALLNNDTEAGPAWLGELVKALNENIDVGLCASKMMNYFNRNLIDNAGDMLCYYGHTVGRNEIDAGQYDRPRYIFSACAGAAIYRKELFADVGFFDEDFFAYYEDIDIGMRAQLKGYKCLYVPAAVVYHMIQATSGQIPAKRFIWMQRNIICVHLKNMPVKLLGQIAATFFILHSYSTLLYIIKTKDIKTIIKLYCNIIKILPRTIKKRSDIQKQITVPASYIKSIAGPFPTLFDYFKKHISRIKDFFKTSLLDK
ncbi:MAG: Poly-beta-1,6-N-acetyl-D-glucosamine synthase [Pelotomaculum sp. PtaU1.Bin035]|nr:MAG: Poly-beta-1,6-N-acetyl-D-glucosamine synthase [Pelotomaculum sp. PtaU1.Bin035]